ncbi:unnamed protein product [Protopolystoma xenopodis]|uniref:Uncharacterized protein n=1 Tax=Protopolystoma xenopodis TaxID=117903 RepID=A0A448WMI7_9PLAT|nr:unnamed protein product [Protopolystoma xenopodis]
MHDGCSYNGPERGSRKSTISQIKRIYAPNKYAFDTHDLKARRVLDASVQHINSTLQARFTSRMLRLQDKPMPPRPPGPRDS